MDTKDAAAVLGTGDIRGLLVKYSVPAIIAMLASSLYNIVDSIFIGQGVGALAITGLAITFPLMNITAAFGAMVGVGGSSLISIKLGQRDIKAALLVLGNVSTLNVALGIVIAFFGLLFLDPILIFFGASANTLPYAREYMGVILYGNVVTHLYLGLNSLLRSTGSPNKAMITTLFTVVVNAALDPLFIFVFEWGIRGAAFATVISQVLALIYTIYHFNDPGRQVRFRRGIYALRRRIVGGIVSIGMSSFIMNFCACWVVILINKSLYTHGGDLAIGAYGIINRVMMLFLMIALGLTQGMQPIAGYNYGAQRLDRVTSVVRMALVAGVAIMTVGLALFEIFPRQIARAFTTDSQLVELAANGLRIVAIFCPLIGLQVVASNLFQSIGRAKMSIFLSTTRQLLFLIPLVLVLPRFLGLNGVWYSMAISDFVATILAVIVLRRQLNAFAAAGTGNAVQTETTVE